jgi:hypothetical protein
MPPSAAELGAPTNPTVWPLLTFLNPLTAFSYMFTCLLFASIQLKDVKQTYTQMELAKGASLTGCIAQK